MEDPEEKHIRQKQVRREQGEEEGEKGKISSHTLTKKKKQLPLKMAINGYIFIKQGAVVNNLKKPITRAIQISSNVYFSQGYSMFITSGEEGNHSAGSLHYVNLAFDSYPARIIKPSQKEIEYFNNKIAKELGKEYDLVDHKGSHTHIEFDPKR